MYIYISIYIYIYNTCEPHVFTSEAAADHLTFRALPQTVAAIPRRLQCAYDCHDSMEPARYHRRHSKMGHPNTARCVHVNACLGSRACQSSTRERVPWEPSVKVCAHGSVCLTDNRTVRARGNVCQPGTGTNQTVRA